MGTCARAGHDDDLEAANTGGAVRRDQRPRRLLETQVEPIRDGADADESDEDNTAAHEAP